jgi:hypothetical protein
MVFGPSGIHWWFYGRSCGGVATMHQDAHRCDRPPGRSRREIGSRRRCQRQTAVPAAQTTRLLRLKGLRKRREKRSRTATPIPQSFGAR